MPIAAIICATVPSSDSLGLARAQLYFAGQSVMEYQARQAREAGIDHVIALVDAVTPALSRTVDRLMADGLKVQLVRDMPTLMRDIPRDTHLLLMSDGAIVAQEHVSALVQVTGNGVLVAEDSGATGHLERIDGMHRWCGLARIAPETVFETLDLIGDWDLALTLLRAAVQAGAKRITVPQSDILEGRAAIVDRQASADLVAQALLTRSAHNGGTEVGAEHYLLFPLARMLSGRLVRMQVPGGQLRLAAIGVALLGMAALYPRLPLLAMILLLFARVIDLAADQLGIMARRPGGDGYLALAPMGFILLGILCLGQYYSALSSAVYLAALTGIIWLHARNGREMAVSRWGYLSPGTALFLITLGMVLGQAGAMILVATMLAIVSVGALLLRRERVRG
jgi:hypothetical protein